MHPLRLLHAELLTVDRLAMIDLIMLTERHPVLSLRMVIAMPLLADSHALLHAREVAACLLTLLLLGAHHTTRIAVAAALRVHLKAAPVERLHTDGIAAATMAVTATAAVE
jgi:hypothetical protein